MFKKRIPLYVTIPITIFVGAVVVAMSYGLVHQYRTQYFAGTIGRVDSIKETVSHGKNTYYGIDISYHYVVNQHTYVSDRLRYMQGSSSLPAWAEHMLDELPVGSHPTVYFDAANPGEAVLIRGLQGEDMAMALFLLAGVLVIVMLWVATVQRWRKTKGFLGLRVIDQGNVTRIRPSCWAALALAVQALAIIAFVGFAVLDFGFGADPSMAIANAAWVAVLGVAVFVGLAKFARIRLGIQDVNLDDGRAVLTAPKNVHVPYRDICGIDVATKTKRNGRQTITTYEVRVNYKVANGAPTHLKVEDWAEQETEARRFAAWLGLRLNVTVDGAPQPA